jgi:hypothetical protein
MAGDDAGAAAEKSTLTPINSPDDTQKAKAQQTLPGLAFGPGMRHAGGMAGPRHRH